ncbi:MAG TPA: MmcQ/YjbR family DNA-binding protein [Propionibacteriaceae bacterium]|nr:MmcQ/YjbR family DNA-binding protein [Propionibacteriaceae bacterium]
MAHPVMYDEDDPVLARVRELALALPGAAEKVTHGWPAFYTVKVFAYYGGSIKVDGRYVRHDSSLLVLPEPGEYEALAQDVRVYRPAYLGPYGWLGLDLGPDTDWTEVAELLDASYRITAPRRLVSQLDSP